jgi:hypothetical protein
MQTDAAPDVDVAIGGNADPGVQRRLNRLTIRATTRKGAKGNQRQHSGKVSAYRKHLQPRFPPVDLCAHLRSGAAAIGHARVYRIFEANTTKDN